MVIKMLIQLCLWIERVREAMQVHLGLANKYIQKADLFSQQNLVPLNLKMVRLWQNLLSTIFCLLQKLILRMDDQSDYEEYMDTLEGKKYCICKQELRMPSPKDARQNSQSKAKKTKQRGDTLFPESPLHNNRSAFKNYYKTRFLIQK